MIKTFLRFLFLPLWKVIIGGLFAIIQIVVFIFPDWQPILTWPTISKWIPWYWWLIILLVFWLLSTVWEMSRELEKINKKTATKMQQTIEQSGTEGNAFLAARDMSVNIGDTKEKKSIYSINSDRKPIIINQLAQLSTEYTNAKIKFMSLKHKSIAKEINDIFKSANWKTTFIESPQDKDQHNFQIGLEFSGFDSDLVKGVVRCFQISGIKHILQSYKELGVQPENPKYPFSKASIYITIWFED